MELVIAMGKLKQIEKNLKNVEKKESVSQRDELKNLIIVIVTVIVIFLVFYAITTLINPKKEIENSQVITETIQYEKILVGEILNRSETNYYVLVKNSSQPYNDLYDTYLQMFVTKDSDNTYYVADLEDAFNKGYYAETTNVSGNDVSKYQFNSSVLIKVKKNKLDKVYTEHDAIIAALEKLIK